MGNGLFLLLRMARRPSGDLNRKGSQFLLTASALALQCFLPNRMPLMSVVFEGACWLIGFATAKSRSTAPSLDDGEYIATYRQRNGVGLPLPFIDSAGGGLCSLGTFSFRGR
jgi:hypothetical protein